jgi:hypothetical protein
MQVGHTAEFSRRVVHSEFTEDDHCSLGRMVRAARSGFSAVMSIRTGDGAGCLSWLNLRIHSNVAKVSTTPVDNAANGRVTPESLYDCDPFENRGAWPLSHDPWHYGSMKKFCWCCLRRTWASRIEVRRPIDRWTEYSHFPGAWRVAPCGQSAP